MDWHRKVNPVKTTKILRGLYKADKCFADVMACGFNPQIYFHQLENR